MVDLNSSIDPSPLREEDLRQGIELLFYAYRDFTGEPDAILDKYDLGRAHHRVIYFVGRNPGITVTELLEIGSGKVLTGMAKRIDARLAARALNTPEDIEGFLG